MGRDELRARDRVSSRPRRAARRGRLVDALLADVEREPGALPLLSTALLELWQPRDGRRLPLAAYERGAASAGPSRGWLRPRTTPRPSSSAASPAEILAAARRRRRRRRRVRRRVPLAELGARPETAPVLVAFADRRLLTVDAGKVEVAHEALLREWPRLRGWLEEDVDGRRLHHHLSDAAREWDAGGRDAGDLYRGARLAAALDWSAAHDDGARRGASAPFLDESRAASERSHRRLRAVLAGVVALLVLAVVAGLLALDQRGSARDQATAADAQRLGSRALAENDLDRSLLLARQGVALDDSPQTRGNLLAALITSPAAVRVMRGSGERFSALTLSPDERTVAAGDSAGNVFLFDARTGRRVTTPEVHPGDWAIAQLAYSPDGRRLAIAHDHARRPHGDAHGHPHASAWGRGSSSRTTTGS